MGDVRTLSTLILIVVTAFVLRFNQVTQIPPSLNWDEVSIGYNAYSILTTGRDEWGEVLPLHFKSYGEYKLPVQVYGSVPGIALFGLNELGVRITPVVYGTLTVMVMFFLGRVLFQNHWIGLLSAFLLAISPWHIHLTRASFESSFALFWVSLGIWWLIKGFKKAWWLVWSMIPLALAVYTYNSARVFVPLFLIVMLLISWRKFVQLGKQVVVTALVFGLFMLPLVPFSLSGESSARYKLVSITDDPGLIPRINENRGNSVLPEPLPRLVHNRVTYISAYFLDHYLAHFTPQFLFISGAPHKQHHVQGIGQLYLIQAPFLLAGLWWLFKTGQQFKWLLMVWMLLSFVPVAITNDSIPHALRTLITVPVYQLLTAAGFFYSLKLLAKPRLIKQTMVALVVAGLLIQMISYLNNYYNLYPQRYSRDWQYGYKQVVQYLKDHQDGYDQIVFSRHYGEPHMFTLFYLNYDPGKFQNDPNLVRFETYDWVRVLRFDKYYFPDLGDEGTRYSDIVAQNSGQKILLVGKPGDFPKTLPRLLTVNFLNGQPAFEIIEKK